MLVRESEDVKSARRPGVVFAALVGAGVVIAAVLGGLTFVNGSLRTQGDLRRSMDASRDATETLAATSGWNTILSLEGSGAYRTDVFEISQDRVLVKLRSTAPDSNQEDAAIFALLSASPWRLNYMRNVWTQFDGSETVVILEVPPGRYYATVQGFGPWEVSVLEP